MVSSECNCARKNGTFSKMAGHFGSDLFTQKRPGTKIRRKKKKINWTFWNFVHVPWTQEQHFGPNIQRSTPYVASVKDKGEREKHVCRPDFVIHTWSPHCSTNQGTNDFSAIASRDKHVVGAHPVTIIFTTSTSCKTTASTKTRHFQWSEV